MNRKKIVRTIAVLVLILLSSACQPTPKTPRVIYRGEGLPEGCMIDPIPEGQQKGIDAPEHWKEEAPSG